jgi:dihydroorotate dehydrogenase electron transfer subunit
MVKSMSEFYRILANDLIAKQTYKMVLEGDTSKIQKPGQFINIKIGDSYKLFLRRPISICDYDDKTITIIYKVFGEGTEELSKMLKNDMLDILLPLGNGFNVKKIMKKQLIIGGGVGVPPLYNMAKKLLADGISFDVVLGFNSAVDCFLIEEFKELGVDVYVATIDGSLGYHGNVLDLIKSYQLDFDYYYACGPKKMLHALVLQGYDGQLSFEERMGCGFGACMGCSHKTKTSYKRICIDGPVLESSEVVIDE